MINAIENENKGRRKLYFHGATRLGLSKDVEEVFNNPNKVVFTTLVILVAKAYAQQGENGGVIIVIRLKKEPSEDSFVYPEDIEKIVGVYPVKQENDPLSKIILNPLLRLWCSLVDEEAYKKTMLGPIHGGYAS